MLLLIPLLLSPLQRTLQVVADSDAYAQGNLFIVFTPKIGRQHDSHPLTTNLTELWCQATRPPGEKRLGLSHAQFVHVIRPDPRSQRIHEAVVENDRAHLRFGHVSSEKVGKYRCEIVTDDGDKINGNLFVYMRPIFHSNGSMKLEPVSGMDEPFHIAGSSKRVTEGETAHLTCPVMGHPIPSITWLRDGQPLNKTDERIVLISTHLYIRDVAIDDSGNYSCIAVNSFAPEPDGIETEYSAVLDQQLRVGSSLAWLLPLIVIIMILLVLFIVIYCCAAWKQRKHDQYNVAEREKYLRKAEEERLQGDEEEE